ncbi:MAG: hypothetical protein KDA60_15775, partial [Planctomycetales bacterium]|nr:hypothetical protein [Planctomycetales bacterium]
MNNYLLTIHANINVPSAATSATVWSNWPAELPVYGTSWPFAIVENLLTKSQPTVEQRGGCQQRFRTLRVIDMGDMDRTISEYSTNRFSTPASQRKQSTNPGNLHLVGQEHGHNEQVCAAP